MTTPRRPGRNSRIRRQELSDEDLEAIRHVLSIAREQALRTLRAEAQCYSVAELANLAPVSQKWIRDRIDDMSLKARLIGDRKMVVTHRDWLAFLDGFDLSGPMSAVGAA